MTFRTTRAAEGLARWRWALPQFVALQNEPFYGLSQGVELLGGELVPMNAKSDRHEVLRVEICHRIGVQLPVQGRLITGLGWRPTFDLAATGGAAHDVSDLEGYFEPDIAVFEQCANPAQIAGQKLKLLIEIGNDELAVQTTHKAAIYAKLGVRDYWVIHENTLETRVYRNPGAAGYGRLRIVSSGASVQSMLWPQINLKLSEIGLASI